MPSKDPVLFLDLTALFELDLADERARRRFYDTTHAAATLQGLVNRDGPRLFLRYNRERDDFWWELMTREGGWLEGREVRRTTELSEALAHFRDAFEGLVAWDERVPATSNLASTIAGADRLIAVRHDTAEDSLFHELTTGDGALEVRRTLLAEDGGPLFTGEGAIPGTELPSTGSAKNDAYRWLIAHYLETDRLNPRVLGYYLDAFWLKTWHAEWPINHTLTNHDYIVAERGLVFDLGVWTDEAPVDDPDQRPGTDRETLDLLLRTANERLDGKRMIHVAGYTPWAYKYTDHRSASWDAGGTRGGVATEWLTTEILTSFNAYLDADALSYAAMVNASFYRWHPLPDVLEQNPPPTRERLQAQGILDEEGRIVPANYYAHYVGDYDAAAWLYWNLPEFWTDEARGQVPLSWAFNPNLAERFPIGFAWTRETRTENDFFVAGDSGAGYVNPFHLSEPRQLSGLPSGWKLWEEHTTEWMRRMDLSVVGFVLDGNTPNMRREGWDAYARFAPGGIVLHRAEDFCPRQGVHGDMPYMTMFGDLPHDADEAARVIASQLREAMPRFVVMRSVLRSPSWYADVERRLDAMGHSFPRRVVDLPTLLWLVHAFETDRELHAPPRKNPERRRLEAAPCSTSGLYAVLGADGPFTVVKHDGRPVWKLPETTGNTYLYFGVEDASAYALRDARAILEVEYFDGGEGVFEVHYDSNDPSAQGAGAYKTAASRVERGGTDQWQTVRFVLSDPAFMNRQNNLADFRIWSHGDALKVRQATLTMEPLRRDRSRRWR